MPTTLTLAVPDDYVLARDVCSYGYFLLEPNRWDPGQRTFTRVLLLPGGPARFVLDQPSPRASSSKPAAGHAAPIAQASELLAPAGRALRGRCDRTLDANDRAHARAQLVRMLRLDEPADTIARFHTLDPRWRSLGRGRLMRSPTLFEDVIKTVTSCNVQWPSTITMNQRLCAVLGKRCSSAPPRARTPAHPGPTHAFPGPRTLARARATTLRGRCRTGYRDQRMIELARIFGQGPRARSTAPSLDLRWIEDPSTPDALVRDALLQLPGIGPYAAHNILQLLGRYGQLPLDTESVRHGRSVLGMQGTDAQVMRLVDAHFRPFGEHAFRSYWFELWEFYERRRGPSWTWQRETTGRTFTASQL